MSRSRGRALVAFAIAAAAIALPARRAGAHQVGISRGEYAFDGATLRADITFARGELLLTTPELDADGDGVLTQTDLDRGRATLERVVVGRVLVTSAGAACAGSLDEVRLTEQDGVAVHATFRCPKASASAHVELPLLDDLAPGHRHIARAKTASGESEDVLYRARRAFDAPTSGPLAPAPQRELPATNAKASSPFGTGLFRGLTGFDHLLFMLGLVATSANLRRRLGSAGAFVAGVVIGTMFATSGLWAPSPRVVGPAIALSLAYIGVENLFAPSDRTRLVALPFGVVHGVGLASVLAVALPASGRALSLLAVEAGVALASALALAATVALTQWATRSATTQRMVGAGVAAAGAAWFVARLFFTA